MKFLTLINYNFDSNKTIKYEHRYGGMNLNSFPEQKLTKVDDLRMECMLMKDISQLVRWQEKTDLERKLLMGQILLSAKFMF